MPARSTKPALRVTIMPGHGLTSAPPEGKACRPDRRNAPCRNLPAATAAPLISFTPCASRARTVMPVAGPRLPAGLGRCPRRTGPCLEPSPAPSGSVETKPSGSPAAEESPGGKILARGVRRARCGSAGAARDSARVRTRCGWVAGAGRRRGIGGRRPGSTRSRTCPGSAPVGRPHRRTVRTMDRTAVLPRQGKVILVVAEQSFVGGLLRLLGLERGVGAALQAFAVGTRPGHRIRNQDASDSHEPRLNAPGR
jgi:hypothetical protein